MKKYFAFLFIISLALFSSLQGAALESPPQNTSLSLEKKSLFMPLSSSTLTLTYALYHLLCQQEDIDFSRLKTLKIRNDNFGIFYDSTPFSFNPLLFPQLTSLDISSPLETEDWSNLIQAPHLHHLKINSKFWDPEIRVSLLLEEIFKFPSHFHLKTLELLNLDLSDEDLEKIPSLDSLQKLRIRNRGLTSDDILNKKDILSPKGILRINEKFKNLTSLYIAGTSLFSPQEWADFLQRSDFKKPLDFVILP